MRIKEEQSESFRMPANFCKTCACGFFELFAVQDINLSAHIIDDLFRSKVLSDVRQARSMDAERARDLFLRERYFIALLAFLNH